MTIHDWRLAMALQDWRMAIGDSIDD